MDALPERITQEWLDAHGVACKSQTDL
jgi:hypothetical protein